MSEKHFAVVVGARPNFVKAAPFFARQKEYPHVRLTLIHTGQHYDANMSRVFFEEMGIPKPDIQLSITGDSASVRLGKMITELTQLFTDVPYDGVIVFGDIDSTVAGTVAARKASRRVLHIESGLRSHDKRMPEEKNRVLVDHLSDVLFTTEPIGKDNLLAEGVKENHIFPVGNLMVESLELFRPLIARSDVISKLDMQEKGYVVATIHRAENTDDKTVLTKIFEMLEKVAQTHTIVLPLHPGTRTKLAQCDMLSLLSTIHVIEPLGYFDFLRLVSGSAGVITDSGGIQEETTHLGIPCATLRDNTERPVTLTHGTNKLFPLTTLAAEDVMTHLERSVTAPASIPLWDDKASQRIFGVLESHFT